MLFVISPAKNLNENQTAPVAAYSQPDLLADAAVLMDELRRLAPQDIAKLMHVSDKIALLNAERNAALWAASIPADDAVRSYLAARGLAQWPVPACIRQHPGLAYWHADDNGELHMLGRYPAMLAPIVSGGKLLAIHRTYLGDGCKADVPTPKKLTAAAGPLAGACIPLAAPHGGVLGIAEGIETAAAASLGSGLPVVAAYCANALAGFALPRGIERLVIFADHDPAGQQAAATLAQRATRAGLTSKTLTPSKPGSDWADVWLEGMQ